MRINYIIFCGLVLLSALFPVYAVNTAKIDVVRGKEILVDADTAVIEEFLGEAFSEFIAKTDFSDIASLRTTIISRSTSLLESGQIQYGPRFFTSVQKEMSSVFKNINALPESYRKTLLTTNLLILVNDLANTETAKMALDYLQSPDVIVRYWAVNSLSNTNILRQLNDTSEESRRLSQEFTQKLGAAAKTEQSGDILILLAQFASGVKQPAANDMLTAISQKRIDLYMAWKADDEMTDASILKALADRTQIDADSSRAMAKNFAILYSLVIQKYIVADQSLSETSRSNLVSVITQSEKLLGRFIPDWQGSLKRAIEKGGGSALLAEADSLFGSASTLGKLPAAAGFDYGRNTDGTAKTGPPELPKPPQAEKKTQTQPDVNNPS
ncbi:MAG: hypothetical protein WC496_02260 [Phycisphaerae bacterium]|jgi:hypothetical protein